MADYTFQGTFKISHLSAKNQAQARIILKSLFGDIGVDEFEVTKARKQPERRSTA